MLNALTKVFEKVILYRVLGAYIQLQWDKGGLLWAYVLEILAACHVLLSQKVFEQNPC